MHACFAQLKYWCETGFTHHFRLKIFYFFYAQVDHRTSVQLWAFWSTFYRNLQLVVVIAHSLQSRSREMRNWGGVYMIPEWISFQNDSHGLFHVYMDVLILEWKCCKSIDGSKTWVSWSAQPIHLLISVPEWTRTSFTWHWWNVQTDFVLERKFGSDATTGMKSFWNDSFRNTILVSIM